MIKNLLGEEDRAPQKEPEAVGGRPPGPDLLSISDTGFDEESGSKEENEPFVISQAPPESYGDTVRRSGLAWSAGIAFFASVVFMLAIGWIADLLFGSSPWGIVFGIILGSLIGFVQFFRITSQIFRK